jgi:DNA-binding phage protein
MNAAKPFDDVAIKLYREDPALAADMLNACLEDGDTEGFLSICTKKASGP